MNTGTIVVVLLSLFMVATALTILFIAFKKGLFKGVNNQAYIPFQDGDVGEVTDQLFKKDTSDS